MSIIKSYAAKEAGADLSLWEYDAGELLPEDVEVEVEYCGICHSDLSMIDNEWGMSSYPLVAGHEVIGRVAALGSAAQDKGLKIGQKVGIGWTARSCGHCDACISGNQINCLEGSVPTIMNRGASPISCARLAMGDPAAGEHRSGFRRPDAVRRHHRLQTAADPSRDRHQPRRRDWYRRPRPYRD